MKKRLTLLLCALVLLSATGCRKTADEDIYGTTEETAVIEETTTDTVIESSTEETAETAVEEEETAQETTSQDNEEATEAATVTEDVYDSESATVAEDHEIADVTVTAEAVNDPEFKASLMTFLDPIYYNVFFGYGDYTEGITEDDMIKFAVSYIYQHEYNELKFDTTNFILYVPEKRVEEIVVRYFDVQLTRHHSFTEDNLMYEDGFYLMPAVDTGWGEELAVKTVTATGDFSYEVLIELTTENASEALAYYLATVEVRDGRFVLTGYVKTDGVNAEGSTEAQ